MHGACHVREPHRTCALFELTEFLGCHMAAHGKVTRARPPVLAHRQHVHGAAAILPPDFLDFVIGLTQSQESAPIW